MSKKFTLWALSFLFALIAFIVYLPSLNSDLVYDAHKEIIDEGFITSASNIPSVISLQVVRMHLILADRPGEMLYLMLNAAIWNKNPFGYHLSSVILHSLNVALLFALLVILTKVECRRHAIKISWKIELSAGIVVLLFSVHPIGVESVSEVSYSSSLLVTLFTLIALLTACALDSAVIKHKQLLAHVGSICVLSAIVCKESGISTLLILMCYWLIFHEGKPKGTWLSFLGNATVLVAAFLVIRFVLARNTLPSEDHISYLGGSVTEMLYIQPRIWVFMLQKMFYPTGLSADYTLYEIDAIPISLSFSILLFVIGFHIWLSSKSKLGALGVAIYWLGLITVSNFIPLYHPLADRYYYLPLTGVALQLMAIFVQTMDTRWALYVIAIVCISSLPIFTLLTLTRQIVFSSEFRLWSDTVQVSPDSSIAHNNLGFILYNKGYIDDSIREYRIAINCYPRNLLAHDNLAIALASTGKIDDALSEYEMALTLAPDNIYARRRLSALLSQRGRVQEALVQLREALRLHPSDKDLRADLMKEESMLPKSLVRKS